MDCGFWVCFRSTVYWILLGAGSGFPLGYSTVRQSTELLADFLILSLRASGLRIIEVWEVRGNWTVLETTSGTLFLRAPWSDVLGMDERIHFVFPQRVPVFRPPFFRWRSSFASSARLFSTFVSYWLFSFAVSFFFLKKTLKRTIENNHT